jgi:hypothetical protein
MNHLRALAAWIVAAPIAVAVRMHDRERDRWELP